MSKEFQYLTLPRPSIYMRLLARWRGGKLVWLEDCEGDRYLTIATEDKYHNLTCPVYPISVVGKVKLLSNGEIHPRSISSYITQWRYA